MQARSGGYDAFEEDIAVINIFFGDATALGDLFYFIHIGIHINIFSEYERSLKMTEIDLISSLGGVFGLFLGFSLMSFVEIVYWFFVVLSRRLIWGK